MQIKLPKPFFFEEGKRAVLLLHGFTGNSADVRQLGRYLQKKGYTSYAPQYGYFDASVNSSSGLLTMTQDVTISINQLDIISFEFR